MCQYLSCFPNLSAWLLRYITLSYSCGHVFVCLQATLHPVSRSRPSNKCYLGDCVHSAEVIYEEHALPCDVPGLHVRKRRCPSRICKCWESKTMQPRAIIRPHTVHLGLTPSSPLPGKFHNFQLCPTRARLHSSGLRQPLCPSFKAPQTSLNELL